MHTGQEGGKYGKNEKPVNLHPPLPPAGHAAWPPGPHAGATHLPRDQSRKCNREVSAPATPSAALVRAGKQGGMAAPPADPDPEIQATSLILYLMLNIFSTFNFFFYFLKKYLPIFLSASWVPGQHSRHGAGFQHTFPHPVPQAGMDVSKILLVHITVQVWPTLDCRAIPLLHGASGDTEVKPSRSRRLYFNVGMGRKEIIEI